MAQNMTVSAASVTRRGNSVTVSFTISAWGGYYCRVKVNGSTWKTSSVYGEISGTWSTTFTAPGSGSATYSFELYVQDAQGYSFEKRDTQSRTASWSAASYTVTFNAAGGSTPTASKSVTYGSTYGTLPTPTRANYIFLGWYTAASGGSQVTSGTTVGITANQTLYAHWQEDFFHGAHVVQNGQAKQVKSVFRVVGGVSAQIRKAYLVTGGQVRQL